MENQVRRRDRLLWPIVIVVGFLIVMLVNGLFIYVAVSGQDEVVPSYKTEPR